MSGKNYYAVLRVRDEANFETLRKAYRARAMECHPDRFAGHPKKEEEFKLVVEAFNVLSDPLSRRQHDLELAARAEGPHSAPPSFEMGISQKDERAILDTLADDILEELIVGNALPCDTSLQTLMLDLEQTEQFCLFREAKTCLYNGATGSAEQRFRQYIAISPCNILARFFLAKCCVANGKWADAEIQLKTGIRLGSLRRPPLQLVRLHHELEHICKSRPGFIGAIRRLFLSSKQTREHLPADEAERRALHRAINRLAMERLGARPLRGELGSKNGDGKKLKSER